MTQTEVQARVFLLAFALMLSQHFISCCRSICPFAVAALALLLSQHLLSCCRSIYFLAPTAFALLLSQHRPLAVTAFAVAVAA
eukprot:scaffold83640_cov15-Tisochrysis_lutea.AAC.1